MKKILTILPLVLAGCTITSRTPQQIYKAKIAHKFEHKDIQHYRNIGVANPGYEIGMDILLNKSTITTDKFEPFEIEPDTIHHHYYDKQFFEKVNLQDSLRIYGTIEYQIKHVFGRITDIQAIPKIDSIKHIQNLSEIVKE